MLLHASVGSDSKRKLVMTGSCGSFGVLSVCQLRYFQVVEKNDGSDRVSWPIFRALSVCYVLCGDNE